MILTHANLDHAGGACFFKKNPGLEIYMSEIEAPFLEDGDEEAISLKMDSLIPSHYEFTLNSGSSHINMAADALKELFIPRMVF